MSDCSTHAFDAPLKPCPFCGGEAEPFNPFDNADGTWCVLCSECAAATGFEQTEAEAIAAWNARADYHGYEQAAIEAWESIKAWNSRAERTCEVESKIFIEGEYVPCSYYEYEMECGGQFRWDDAEPPSHCPNCGARVVE